MLCAPVGAYATLAAGMAPHLAPGATVTDVGSHDDLLTRNADYRRVVVRAFDDDADADDPSNHEGLLS